MEQFHDMLRVQSVSFDYFEEALAAVHRIGPGGHYLGDAFTMKRFKHAFIAPEMLDYLSYEQGRAQGSRDMAQRPFLDPAIREELDAFVEKRQREISPSIA
jgi:trimethylamine--corrinoid protein Co-methyltransferase